LFKVKTDGRAEQMRARQLQTQFQLETDISAVNETRRQLNQTMKPGARREYAVLYKTRLKGNFRCGK
jgi:hypothetical protein